jgi:hypothetical protein
VDYRIGDGMRCDGTRVLGDCQFASCQLRGCDLSARRLIPVAASPLLVHSISGMAFGAVLLLGIG